MNYAAMHNFCACFFCFFFNWGGGGNFQIDSLVEKQKVWPFLYLEVFPNIQIVGPEACERVVK